MSTKMTMKLINGMPQVVFETVPEFALEVEQETSRDHHLAARAAEQIANGIDPFTDTIELEELEALAEWTNQAVMDRGNQRVRQQVAATMTKFDTLISEIKGEKQ